MPITLGIATPDLLVDINTDYSITSKRGSRRRLTQATMGDLSRENYPQEMKRRGTLKNEFSLADSEDCLSVELA